MKTTGSFDISKYIIFIVFIVIFAFFSITLLGKGFLTPTNLMNIARQVAMISIMAVGVTFVLCAAEIDLSFGAVVALSSVITALMLRWTAGNIVLSVFAGMSTGIITGLCNGILVGYVGIPGFLVTLGTTGIIIGIARRVTLLKSCSAQQ